MNRSLFFLVLILLVGFATTLAIGQEPRPVYNRQNKLIAIYNLSGVQNCGTRTMTGTVKSVRTYDNSTTHFVLKTRRTEETAEIHLEILSNVDRANLFYSLLKRRKAVEIQGYTCGSNGILDTIYIKSIR